MRVGLKNPPLMMLLFYSVGQMGVRVWDSGTKESTSHDVIFLFCRSDGSECVVQWD
jgi:hypothetical protein